MNTAIDVIYISETQAHRPAARDATYTVFDLKRAPNFGRLLGSAGFYISGLQLHLYGGNT